MKKYALLLSLVVLLGVGSVAFAQQSTTTATTTATTTTGTGTTTPGTGTGTTTATTTVERDHTRAPAMMLMINPSGHTQLRGTLVSIGSTTASTTSGNLVVKVWGINWNVSVMPHTENTGIAKDLSHFKPGDIVGVIGRIDPVTGVIQAQIVRNWSITKVMKAERKEVMDLQKALRDLLKSQHENRGQGKKGSTTNQ